METIKLYLAKLGELLMKEVPYTLRVWHVVCVAFAGLLVGLIL